MAVITIAGPSGKPLLAPEGLERTPDDLTREELRYLIEFCEKMTVSDILQHGAGLSSALLSQFAAVTVLESDEDKAKILALAAPPKPEAYNYITIKPPIDWPGAGTTQKYQVYVIGGLRKETHEDFTRVQSSFSAAYELSDVVFVADGLSFNMARLQLRWLAPYYNVTNIYPSGEKDRYLVQWERNLLTTRKSVL
jgi:hypothetical protein